MEATITKLRKKKAAKYRAIIMKGEPNLGGQFEAFTFRLTVVEKEYLRVLAEETHSDSTALLRHWISLSMKKNKDLVKKAEQNIQEYYNE